MLARLTALNLLCCLALAQSVRGGPVLNGSTAHVASTQDFLLCFSPDWVNIIDTVVVENHLIFDEPEYPNYTINKTRMTVKAGGLTGAQEQWELQLPDTVPVLKFTGSSVLHVLGFRMLGVKHGFWFGDDTGLWRVDRDARIIYDSCSIVLDSSVFATVSFFHLKEWEVSGQSIYVKKHFVEKFWYVNVTFLKQEEAVGLAPEVLEVRDPLDIKWLLAMQRKTSLNLEIRLLSDMVIDACVVTAAMGGDPGPIPVGRPVVINGSNSILSFSSDILPNGFLRVDTQPLVIEEITLDLQNLDVWPGDGVDCLGWACPTSRAAIVLQSDQEDCMFSMFDSSIVVPERFLEHSLVEEWMAGGTVHTLDAANIKKHLNDSGDTFMVSKFMFLGMCLVETPIRKDLYRELTDGSAGTMCSDNQALGKSRKELGNIEITIISALGFGIVAVALCLAVLCTVGNKLKSAEKLRQRIKFGFQTSSSSEGLPDSIVVSPDPEMGTYAPRIDMDFKLVLDQAPMWILEEIFNQSNYDQDSSIVIEERIASGGYGVVFKGTWKGIPVAIKTVLFQDMGHKELQENKEKARAIVEAAISSSVAHPNIVQTYAFSFKRVSKRGAEKVKHKEVETRGMGSRKQKHCPRRTHWKLYMVQELCNAGSLNTAMSKRAFMDSANNPCLSYILQIALDAGRGVMHLHRHNIIHGDLSTKNILLQKRAVQKDGVKLTAKIADFGLSRRMDKFQNHIANHWAGTPFYMAPEVVQSGHLSKAADVFSFGVVMWELYHSMECFQEKEDLSINSDDRFQYHPLFPKFPTSCPIPLVMLCVSCLSPDPDDRPSFPLICKALSALQAREKKGHYSSPAAIQASNKETSQAMGRMNSNQIVDIVAMLLAIDSQRSVRSRSMDIAQASAAEAESVPFYWPTEIQVSLNQAMTTHCTNISSLSRDGDNDPPAFEFGAFNYTETEAEHANVTKKGKSLSTEPSARPMDTPCKVGARVDDLDDGLALWSVDADDMDDAEKGLSSIPKNIEADNQPSSRVGIGLTVCQRVRNRGLHSRNSNRREIQWEMDGGVLTGVESTSKTVDDINSLPYVTVLPTLREELTPEGQEERRDDLRSMERIPCASDIFLSVSGEV